MYYSSRSACLQLASFSHQSFITLPLYTVCAFNHFSSCCTSCCNIRGKGVCAGNGICGHKLRRLYKHGGESQPRKKHAALLLQQRYKSPIYAPTYLYRYHLFILTLLSSHPLCKLILCSV